MRIVLIGNFSESIIKFRGELLTKFVAAGHDVIACAPEADANFSERLKMMGINYRSIPLDRTSINPLNDIRTFITFLKLFREVCPDIVINYTIKPVVYASLAAWLSGVHSIYSIITGLGYVFIGNSRRQKLIRCIVCTLLRLALACNKKLFFLNRDDLETFTSYGLVIQPRASIQLLSGEGINLSSYQRCVVLDGSGVNLDTYSIDNNYTTNNNISFLLIGRLIRDKGIMEYVEASRILSSKYVNVKFRLLGPYDTNHTSISKKQVEDWHKSGVIEYLGETNDVRPFINDANVYVLPSYREGLPRSVIEAMAMECPIVTTDAPGCRETVVHGDNGFIVPVKDAVALAAAMEKFILQPELIKQMGRRSREIAEKKFDVHKINKVIMNNIGLLNEASD